MGRCSSGELTLPSVSGYISIRSCKTSARFSNRTIEASPTSNDGRTWDLSISAPRKGLPSQVNVLRQGMSSRPFGSVPSCARRTLTRLVWSKDHLLISRRNGENGDWKGGGEGGGAV